MSVRDDLRTMLSDSAVPFAASADILDKDYGKRMYTSYMLDRTNSMFSYTNLPDTIPAYLLELYLQIFGYACITHIDSSLMTQYSTDQPNITPPSGLYAFYGSVGGERDIYYRPTRFIVANPRLKSSCNKTVVYANPSVTVPESEACVVIRNDTNYSGLVPLFARYAAQLVENDISIRCAQINARAQTGIATSTDAEKATAELFFRNLEAGKLGVVGTSAFLNGVTVSNIGVGSANLIIQLIELQQYLKASWYNELGLNANFNMKREYLSRDEIATTTDVLLPLVDDMLNCRKEAVELINKTFGTNINVEKSSAWANKNQEVLASITEASNDANIPVPNTINSEEGDTSATAVQSQQNSNVQNGESNKSSVSAGNEQSGIKSSSDSGSDKTDGSVATGQSNDSSNTESDASQPSDGGSEQVNNVINVTLTVATDESEVEVTSDSTDSMPDSSEPSGDYTQKGGDNDNDEDSTDNSSDSDD